MDNENITGNEMDERIKNILADTKGGLTKDSVAAIVCLEDEINEDQRLIKLIKKGDVTATYEGDRTRPYDPDKFLIKAKNEMIKKGGAK